MQGEISGIALELKSADGTRLPVLVTSTVKTGGDGEPLLIRTTVFDARDRRAYEEELLRAHRESNRERERLQQLTTTLQKTLLPSALANVPGLDIAAHYHVASIDEVGGDFYDLFPLAGGSWGMFLGDVCGKGARPRSSPPWPATPCAPPRSTTPIGQARPGQARARGRSDGQAHHVCERVQFEGSSSRMRAPPAARRGGVPGPGPAGARKVSAYAQGLACCGHGRDV